MTKIWKFFEYVYLFIAIGFIVETAVHWTSNKNRAYLFLIFAFVAIFMYFFRRHFRKKMEHRKKQ